MIHWWILDLIPKNPKSSNFGKKFLSYFKRQKLIQKNETLIFFVHAFSEKMQKQKKKILKNLFFHRNQRKILIRGNLRSEIFNSWIKSYEAIQLSEIWIYFESEFYA